MPLSRILAEPLPQALFWSALTILCYWLARTLHRRWRHPALMPLALTPALVGAAMLALHTSYSTYITGTHWLLLALGPVTVAFAIPIYEQRALLRRHWPVLLVGTTVGNATAMASSWGLATALGLSGALRLSLVPRSMSTPFAIQVSHDIGAVPDLTAVFVAITGIAGAILGDLMLNRLNLGSAMARGALLGAGAHGAGTARAQQIGQTEGAVAGLVMMLVGLANVLAAPLVELALR